MHRNHDNIQATVERTRGFGRRAAGMASEPEVRDQARAASESLARAIRRSQKLGWRRLAGDRRVRRDIDTAVDAVAAIIEQGEPPRRRSRILRALTALGMVGGGVFLIRRVRHAQPGAPAGVDAPS